MLTSFKNESPSLDRLQPIISLFSPLLCLLDGAKFLFLYTAEVCLLLREKLQTTLGNVEKPLTPKFTIRNLSTPFSSHSSAKICITTSVRCAAEKRYGWSWSKKAAAARNVIEMLQTKEGGGGRKPRPLRLQLISLTFRERLCNKNEGKKHSRRQ